jgi:hypothetical protein
MIICGEVSVLLGLFAIRVTKSVDDSVDVHVYVPTVTKSTSDRQQGTAALLRPGFYRIRLTAGGRFVALKVWFGAPEDPHNPGHLLDRSPRWQYQLGKSEVKSAHAEHDLEKAIWSSREEIDEAEYRYLLEVVDWDERNANGPGSKEKIDFGKLKHEF